MSRRSLVFLLAITSVAFLLRFYRLSFFPPLNADEAAIGYNAYSLLRTGLDEHGSPWPIHFKSFGDYKPGLIFYLVMPFVHFMGLSTLAVRLFPAALGVLNVPAMYLLTKELVKKDKGGREELVALSAALLLAISPWHIHFSRGAWEVNVASFLITVAVWLFMRWTHTQSRLVLLLSIFGFVLSLYTYHAARVVVPLLALGTALIYKPQLKSRLRELVPAAILALLLVSPLIIEFTGPAGFSRASGVSIFADEGIVNRINEQRGNTSDPSSTLTRLRYNKVFGYSRAFLENYFEHFSPSFLFLSGDEIQRNKVPGFGQLYLIQLPLIILGTWHVWKRGLESNGRVLLWWLAVSPVAAALTFQSPHALRAQPMVIPLTVLSAYGLVPLVNFISRHLSASLRAAGYALVVAAIAVGTARYLHSYYVRLPVELPFSSQYGVKELVEVVRPLSGEYEKIVVTDRYDQPYILFLFYMNYSPKTFQREHTLSPAEFGFLTVRNFANFEFRRVNWEEDWKANTLLVGSPDELPDGVSSLKTIKFPNGEDVFLIVDPKINEKT